MSASDAQLRLVDNSDKREVTDLARKVLARALTLSLSGIANSKCEFDYTTGDIAVSITEGSFEADRSRARRIELRAVELLERLASNVSDVTQEDVTIPEHRT